MEKRDFRSLSLESQYDIRLSAIRMLKKGKTQTEVSSIFQVRQQTISDWWQSYKNEGMKGLRLKQRGRRTGEKRRLTSEIEKAIQKTIVDRCPEQLKLPFVLWNREAVQVLIKKKYGIRLPMRTVGEYLQRWGFTPKKPVKRAYEQQPEKVKKWLDEEYPKIARDARREGAEIHWCDETGMSSEANVCKGYSPIGIKPVMRTSGKRFSLSMISSITNQGQLRYMMFKGGLKVDIFIDFLKRLIKSSHKTVYLILDNLRVHHALRVREWVSKQNGRIKLFFLPPYSPEYNPDEYLNQDLKVALSKKPRPTSQKMLKANAQSHMKSLSKKAKKIMNFFNQSHVRYAAA